MRRIFLGLATGLLLSGSASPARAQSRGMEILQAASRRYADVTSMCADFVQHLVVPLLGQEHTASGRMCQAAPDRFGMRFTDPPGGLFLVDGESVWYYMPDTDAKQAFHYPLERGTEGRDFNREFLESPETKYDVSYVGEEMVDNKPTDHLHLVPKVPTSYRTADLWIEKGTSILRQVKVVQESENERTITFRNIDFGATPPTGFFEFTVPSGVLVVTP